MSRPGREGFISGNCLTLLRDGREAFPSMLRAIGRARESVNLETYILRSDETGKKFSRQLRRAARRGVEVNLLFDSLGSFGISQRFLAELEAEGVRLLEYHPFFSQIGHRYFRRNHRKSLAVDGRFGFVGGMNIGNEYASRKAGGEGWRDTMVAIEGPAVLDLQRLFVSTWNRHGRPWLGGPKYFPDIASCGNERVRIIGNTRRRMRRAIRRSYLRAIQRARRFVLIENAYFIPDRGIRRALRNACRRGVEVAVVLAGKTDVRAVQLASHALYQELMESGVRIFEWQRAVLHAKTAVVDGKWSTVGSYNMDRRSLLHNLEVNAAVRSRSFGSRMEAMLRSDMSESLEMDLNSWKLRPWKEKFLETFFYWLRYFL